MSESTARAERRALRRVVGPELLSFTEDTTQAIRTLQAGLTTITAHHAADSASIHVVLDQTVDNVTRQHAQLREHARQLDTHYEVLCTIDREQRAFVGRSFLARLRWLLTGR